MKYCIFVCSIFLFSLWTMPAAAFTVSTLNITDDSMIRSDHFNQSNSHYLEESVNIYNGGSNDYRFILGAYIPANYCELPGKGDVGDEIVEVKLWLYSWRQSGAGNNVCIWESADKVANAVIPWEEYGGTYFVDWYDTGTTTPAEWDDANGTNYRGGSIYDPTLLEYDVLDCHSTLPDTPDATWESWTVFDADTATTTVWEYGTAGRLTVVLDHWPSDGDSLETGYWTSEYIADTSKRPYYQITCDAVAVPEVDPPPDGQIITNGDNWYYSACVGGDAVLPLDLNVGYQASTTVFASFNCDGTAESSGQMSNNWGFYNDNEIVVEAQSVPGYQFYCLKTETISNPVFTDYDQIGITWLPATSSACAYNASSTRSEATAEFCADPCASLATTSDFLYGMNCGARQTLAWLFCLDEITTTWWKKTINKGSGKFPFSLFSDLNAIIASTTSKENATTTLPMWDGREAQFNTASVGFGWDSVLAYVKLAINIAITVALILIILFLYVIPPPNREDE